MRQATLSPPSEVGVAETRPLAVRFVLGVLAALLLGLGLFYGLMQPEVRDLGLMVLFLAATSLITLVAGFLAYRLGWLDRAPSLRWALLATYALSGLLTFINVWLTARLMFVNRHDLVLATVLLIFATAMALALGLFFSEALARRLRALSRAAQRWGSADMRARALVVGSDEVARLARAFNEMADRQQALERARRELVAWAGHDLQTPLASIRAILEALADDVIEDPLARRRYIETAKRQVSALSSLLDDLFQIAQMDAGGLELQVERASLADLVSDTLEGFSALAAERGVNLGGHVGQGVDPVRMDPRRIGRVLDNLVGNALRHTPRGGQVHVRAGREGAQVWVEVQDSGEGIDPAHARRIFEPFYRAEPSRSRATGGSGLGLAIARGFIQAHGGSIQARQAPGGGALFRLAWPG
jgi:signal transduction histidine kinase